MSTAPDFWLDNPPVWELSLTVQTEANGLVSGYDIKSAHDLVRDKHPGVARHEPVDLLLQGPRELSPTDPLVRWWFTSPDDHYLVQLQENLLAYNWRRLILPPGKVDYPGYTHMRGTFEAILAGLRAQASSEFPNPRVAEIAYDNFLPLPGRDGEVESMSELLVMLAGPMVPPVAAFQMGWFETHGDADAQFLLRVQIANVIVAGPDGEPRPSLRMNLNCRADLSDWGAALRFFDAAHSVARKRFMELTTKRAHTIWGLR